MYDKLRADVTFLRGDYEKAAEMYREGARDGDIGAAFNYGYCLWRRYRSTPPLNGSTDRV